MPSHLYRTGGMPLGVCPAVRPTWLSRLARLARALLAAALAAGVVSCGDHAPPRLTESDALVVVIRDRLTTHERDQQAERIGSRGFESDLVEQFAASIGKPLRLVIAQSDQELYEKLKSGEAHFGAGWLPLPDLDADSFVQATPYGKNRQVIVQNDASLPLAELSDLAGKTIHVVEGSKHADRLKALTGVEPPPTIIEHKSWDEFDLVEAVSDQRIEYALTDSRVMEVASNFYPTLQTTLEVGGEKPVSWLFPADGDPDLLARANAFLDESLRDGTLARLIDRYFGHIRRLDRNDVISYLEAVHSLLPDYEQEFKRGQIITGIDWRLLAALAYQESKWNPLATSPTGVRGMMMLTEDTADHLGVKNRLDASESIRAGSRYLADLRDQLPPEVKEPDRTWMALAAYNLGLGHMNGARAIAPSTGADPDQWFEMKKVLPLLSRPQYYSRLKSGRARGGEAVILVENVRMFYDILQRHAPAYVPLAPPKKSGRGGKTGRA